MIEVGVLIINTISFSLGRDQSHRNEMGCTLTSERSLEMNL